MNTFVSMLGKSWKEVFTSGDWATTKYSWIAQVFDPISIVLYILMGIVGAAGAVYAVYLGIQLARADEQSKRDEAKKHLITVLIAIAVTVVLILFFNLLLPEIVSAIITDPNAPTNNNNNNNGNNANLVITAAKMLIHR